MSLVDTIGNQAWLEKNETAIKKLLPPTWTHVENINMLQVGYGLKLLGVDWRSDEELARCMAFFVSARLMLRDGWLFRARP